MENRLEDVQGRKNSTENLLRFTEGRQKNNQKNKTDIKKQQQNKRVREKVEETKDRQLPLELSHINLI